MELAVIVVGPGATMGDGFCSGMCVTPAISLGRLLGRQRHRWEPT